MERPVRVLSTRPATLPPSGPVATAMSLSLPRNCPCASVTGVPRSAVRLTRIGLRWSICEFDAAPKIECRVESRPTERSLLPVMRGSAASNQRPDQLK